LKLCGMGVNLKMVRTGSPRRSSRRRLSLPALTAAAAMVAVPLVSQSQSLAASLTQLPRGPINLTMWTLPATSLYKQAVAQVTDFEKIYPQIHIKVIEEANVGSPDKMFAAAITHSLPDILWSADVLTGTEAEHHVLLNLSPYMKAYGYKDSEFDEGVLILGQYRGNQYVIPSEVDQITMGLNPNIFKIFGVPLPKEGITWQQYAKLGPELTRKVNGVQYYAQDGQNYTDYPIQEALVHWYGGTFTNPAGTKCTLNQPQAYEGFAEMISWEKKYSTADLHLPTPAWEAGHAATEWSVRPGFNGDLNSSGTAWDLPFKPVFVNFPLLEPHPGIGAGMYGYAITTDTKYPNAAAAFAMYLLSKRGEIVGSQVTGGVPLRKDLANSPVWTSYPHVGYNINPEAFIDYSQYQVYPPQNVPIAAGGVIQTAIGNAVTAIDLGSETPQQAFNSACAVINAQL